MDEIRHENIRYIDAGQRHSLAISDSKKLWLWGQGIHGAYDVPDPDPSSTSILYPIKVSDMLFVLEDWAHCSKPLINSKDICCLFSKIELPELSLISARAGRGRTFVWGDRGRTLIKL